MLNVEPKNESGASYIHTSRRSTGYRIPDTRYVVQDTDCRPRHLVKHEHLKKLVIVFRIKAGFLPGNKKCRGLFTLKTAHSLWDDVQIDAQVSPKLESRHTQRT